MNLCIYVPVQLMMLLVSQITHSDGWIMCWNWCGTKHKCNTPTSA
jgi:hypothetical protein